MFKGGITIGQQGKIFNSKSPIVGTPQLHSRLYEIIVFESNGEAKIIVEKKECKHLKALRFGLLSELHTGARAPVFYPDYEARLAQITLTTEGEEPIKIKKWKNIPIDFQNKSFEIDVKWGTCSDVAIANAPNIESASLMVFFLEEIDNTTKTEKNLKDRLKCLGKKLVMNCPNCNVMTTGYHERCPQCGAGML